MSSTPVGPSGGVAGGESLAADQPGHGFDHDVGLVAVAIGAHGLVDVPAVGVDGGDHPVRGSARRDPPAPLAVARLDVLAGDQRQQADRFAGRAIELESVDSGEHDERVVDQSGHELLAGFVVVPGDAWLARIAVVMAGQLEHRRLGDEAADPADRRDQLGHRVLRGDRVIQHGRVQRPPHLAFEDPGRIDHRAHRVEDPLRPLADAQLVAPQREHRRVEPLIIERQTGRDLPTQIGPQRRDRVAVRQALQGLQHHRRGDHIRRHRRTTPTRREQIGEQLVGEHLTAMLSQEPIHRPGRHKMPDQRLRIQ
jgi:hypothetical protein